MKHIYTFLLILVSATTTTAQWYFELGTTNSNLASYSVTAAAGSAQVPTPTNLESYSGLRDFSHGLGYLFSFKSKEARHTNDGKPAFFRLGVGAGFEQSNLRTNATIRNVAYPNI